MKSLLFILLSLSTIFFSIKLSIYAENINKTTKVSGAIIGGVLLAGVTSLPEFITCLSSIYMNNSELAMGDIIGSNLFNIFIICIFDIIYYKKTIFLKTNQTHIKIFILLLIDYLFIFLYMKNIIKLNFITIGFPSLVIIILYFFYIITIKKEKDVIVKKKVIQIKHVYLKLIGTIIMMIISSCLLTIVVNNIAISYPIFSSSAIGAILLGITTSLPEVVTYYTLINVNDYDMALDDIIGSNLFNLFVLSIGDITLKGYSIYDFPDKNCFMIFSLCFIFNILNLLQNIRKKAKSKITYVIPSIIMSIIYILYWFYSFMR